MDQLPEQNQYLSSWEWCRARSRYHFDWNRHDQPDEWFQVKGNIEPCWHEELGQIRSRARPITWATRNYLGLGISPMLPQEHHDLDMAGADRDLELTDCVEDFTGYPKLQALADFFDVQQAKKVIHTQITGQMFNLHIDKLYARCPEDPDKIVRITIMLEDWLPGQFYLYGTKIYSHWKAGDVHIFSWRDVPHATANASLWPRSTMQITGIRSCRTDELLSTQQQQWRLTWQHNAF
jgi:hypothetical protein